MYFPLLNCLKCFQICVSLRNCDLILTLRLKGRLASKKNGPLNHQSFGVFPKKLIFMSKPKHFVKWQLLKVFGGARTSWFLLWNILRNMLWKTHWPLEMLLLPSLKSSSIYYFDVIQKRTCQVKLNESVALMDCSAAVLSFTCSHIALGCSWV